MKQSRLFDRILMNEKRTKNRYGINLNKLFEEVLQEANDEDDGVGELEVQPEILNRSLSSIFNDVLNQCANENSLNYSNVAVKKKSVPFNHLMMP